MWKSFSLSAADEQHMNEMRNLAIYPVALVEYADHINENLKFLVT